MMIIFRRKRVTCETHTVHGKAPQIHRWLSDLLVARVSFWTAVSAPGVTGEWGSALGEAREKVATGRRAPGEETVFFRLRNSSLLFLYVYGQISLPVHVTDGAKMPMLLIHCFCC